MTPLETALQEIRDAAHINSLALESVRSEAQTVFDTVRTYPDSGTKRMILSQLGTLVSSYTRGRDEAVELRDLAAGQLAASSEDPLPPLPEPGSGHTWSTQDW